MKKEQKMYRGKVLNISSDLEVEVGFNDWVYGGLVYDEDEDEFNIVFIDEESNPRAFLPKQDTIGRCTLRKDSKGELVFQGDILHLEENEDRVFSGYFIIIDDHGDLGVARLDSFNEGNWKYNTLSINRSLGKEIIKNSRVVGNIVDDPEWVATHQGEY